MSIATTKKPQSVDPIATKKKVVKKAVVEAKQVPVEAPVEAPKKTRKVKVVEAPTEVEVKPVDERTVIQRIEATNVLIIELIKALKVIQVENKQLKSLHIKEVKAGKKKRKNNNNGEPRKPHGFIKPQRISDELADYIGKEHGSLVTRPSVTKVISAKIKEFEMYNVKDKSIFTPNEELYEILGKPLYKIRPKQEDSELGYSYQNLQKYLTPHFPKDPVVTDTSV